MDLPILLHVDGSEDDRILLERIHRRHAPPSRLVQLASAEAARTALEGGIRPSLTLVATRLGEENGIDFIHWYRHRLALESKIFLITGSLDSDTTRQALTAGADGVIFRTSDLGRMGVALASVFEAHLDPW